MEEAQEVQHSPETCFTIHMGDPQEVHLSKIGKSTFCLKKQQSSIGLESQN